MKLCREEKNPLDENEQYVNLQTVETKSSDMKGENYERRERKSIG